MKFTPPEWIAIGTTLLLFVVLGFVILYNRSLQDAGNGTRALLDHKDKEDLAVDPDYANLLSAKANATAAVGGKTETYEWTQSEDEVEVIIPLERFGDSLSSREVDVVITAQRLKVIVRREVVLDGAFPAAVRSEESWWSLDNNTPGQPYISINLEKLTPAVKREQFWRCVLQGDPEITLLSEENSQGPPVHHLDASDPEAVQSAIRRLKMNK